MLTTRKDAGTGHKLKLYWGKGRHRISVPKDKHDEYWDREVKRVEAARDWEKAKREEAVKELKTRF